MEFVDEEIENLNLCNKEDFCKLFVQCLCGRRYEPPTKELEAESAEEQSQRRTHPLLWPEEWTRLQGKMEQLKKHTLLEEPDIVIGMEQLNEILLLLNLNRVSKGFFNYFFREPVSSEKKLKTGIIRFRGFSLLRFANVKFAFDFLRMRTEVQIRTILKEYDPDIGSLTKENLVERPPKLMSIKPIPKEDTWLVGELTGGKINKEAALLKTFLENPEKLELGSIQDLKDYFGVAATAGIDDMKLVKGTESLLPEYSALTDGLESNIEIALSNTDVYLTWDFMDVYIATSMRSRWEFEECAEFIGSLGSSADLADIWAKLRVFDPTQSKCDDRIQKGLVEGLMLKRVRCTIYMAQETDTMGKDSELAASLAQGKPVIAFVPELEATDTKKVKHLPLEFFWMRLLVLLAGDWLSPKKLGSRMKEAAIDTKDIDLATAFVVSDLSEYMRLRLFSFCKETEKRDKDFIDKHGKEFENVVRVLTMAQSAHYDGRADVLRKHHPLSLQVNLSTGVANGVLVVRTPEQCAKILECILTKRMRFKIQRTNDSDKPKHLVLLEEITGCIHRVEADYDRLRNSFWNLYFEELYPVSTIE